MKKIEQDYHLLVKFISLNDGLIETIFATEDQEFIELVYRIFLHHGASIKTFILIGTVNDIQKSTVGSSLRGNDCFNKVLSEYFGKCGGDFSPIVEYIRTITLSKKAVISNKNMRKILELSIKFIKENLHMIMSKTLTHFCSFICNEINLIQPGMGEAVVGSFIFLRLICPKLVMGNSEEIMRLTQVAKILMKISAGESILLGWEKLAKSMEEQGKILKQTISQVLFNAQNIDYVSRKLLPPEVYLKNIITFVDRMVELNEEEAIKRVFARAMSHESNLVYRKKFKRTSSDANLDYQKLLWEAKNNKPLESFSGDLRFFLAWSNQDIIKFIANQGMNTAFFEKWKLDGSQTIHLNRKILKLMGFEPNPKVITDLIKQVKSLAILKLDQMPQIALSNWTEKEIRLFLILSEMEHLIPIFQNNNITGIMLKTMTTDDMFALGIIKPTDITKLNKLQRKN